MYQNRTLSEIYNGSTDQQERRVNYEHSGIACSALGSPFQRDRLEVTEIVT